MREGAQVAIVGAPNVGKSSLFNALLNANRAIVTAVPGTTRDLVTERTDMGGLMLALVDTAGVRESSDVVEQEGVARARAAAGVAELVLVMLDRSRPLDEDDRAVLRDTERSRRLVVVNKSDLPSRLVLPSDIKLPSRLALPSISRSRRSTSRLPTRSRSRFALAKAWIRCARPSPRRWPRANRCATGPSSRMCGTRCCSKGRAPRSSAPRTALEWRGARGVSAGGPARSRRRAAGDHRPPHHGRSAAEHLRKILHRQVITSRATETQRHRENTKSF